MTQIARHQTDCNTQADELAVAIHDLLSGIASRHRRLTPHQQQWIGEIASGFAQKLNWHAPHLFRRGGRPDAR